MKLEVRSDKVRSNEVRSLEDRSNEVESMEVRSTEVRSPSRASIENSVKLLILKQILPSDIEHGIVFFMKFGADSADILYIYQSGVLFLV